MADNKSNGSQTGSEDSLWRLRQAAVMNPMDPNSHFELGLALIRAENIDAALKEFKITVQLDPKNGDGFYNLAYCYQLLGYADNAISRYEKALSINQADDLAWHNLAALYLDGGDFPRAAYCATKATESSPDRLENWRIRTLAEYHCKNYNQAEDSARKALEIDKDNAYLWGHHGMILQAMGDWDDALYSLKRALELDSQLGEVWNNTGNCYVELEQVNEAEAAYRKALEIDENNPTYWFNLGELYFIIERFESSEGAFLKSVQLDANDAEAWHYLAEIAENDRPETAIERFQTVLGLLGDRLETLKKLASLYERLKDTQNEIKTRLRINQNDPYLATNNIRLGKLYLDSGKPELCFRYIREIENPDILTISEWDRLAQYFRLKGGEEDELECLSRVIRLKPEHEYAWLRIGKITLGRSALAKAQLFLKKGAGSQHNNITFWGDNIQIFIKNRDIDTALELSKNVIQTLEYSPESFQPIFDIFAKASLDAQLVNYLKAQSKSVFVTGEKCVGIARVLYRNGYINAAEQLSLEDVFTRSGRADNMSILLDCLISSGKLGKYKETLLKPKTGEHPDPEMERCFGRISLELGDMEEAESRYQVALKGRSDDYAALLSLARISYLKGAPNSALAYIEEALNIHDSDYRAWRLMGKIDEYLHRQREASGSYEKAISLNRRDFVSLDRLGALALGDRMFLTAKRSLLKSLAIQPLYAAAWENLELLFKELSDSVKAERCGEIAITARKVIYRSRLCLL